MKKKAFFLISIVALIPILGMGLLALPGGKTGEAFAGTAKVVPKGKLVLAWHSGISTTWLDPQEQPAMLSPTNFTYAVHDALIKQYHGKYAVPALAERWEMSDDFKSATFWLRKGIKFHNGEPVTPADVKFSYENYRGAQAGVFKSKTDRIEIVDDRTIRFHFKEPFLDFPVLYGTCATGAAWIVPAKYYQKVGPDRFKQNPIGAGPYRLVRQQPGVKMEFEAFEGYYKPVHIKNLVMMSVREGFTRVAMLERGEADIVYLIPGELIKKVKSLPGVIVAPAKAGPWWIDFPGMEDPKNPFHDKRVRQAVSLALNRQALSNAETDGYAPPLGNWIPHEWPGAIEWPALEFNLEKARQLMAEAGYAKGFDVDWLSPFPRYFSLAERIISQLRAIGIRTKMQTMERGTFLKLLQGGREAFPGVQMVLIVSASPGDWATRYRAYFKCKGFASRMCVPELDAKFKQYEESVVPAERKRLREEIQREIMENYYTIPVYRLVTPHGIGPTVDAKKWQDVFSTAIYAYPYEEIRLKEK
jgi:peptide/nickel transport system substrate-binding protein